MASAPVSDFKPPLDLGDPLDIDEGRRAAHAQALTQRDALATLEKRIEEAAQAEHKYRVELAKKILKERKSETPVTVISDICRGDKKIAELKLKRDIAEGMVTAQRERVRELEGERAMLRELLEFSRRSLGAAA